MKFENIRVYNFENALRGMRNPKNSWHLSDSQYGIGNDYVVDDAIYETTANWMEAHGTEDDIEYRDKINCWLLDNGVLWSDEDFFEFAFIGPKDMNLARTLIKSGPEHRKFLRQIFVTVDITAPMYWFSEFDTYKVGTVANSTSKMHKLTSKPITIDCFETDDYKNVVLDKESALCVDDIKNIIIEYCEALRQKYLETNDKAYWKELVRWLPEGWLQTRTVTMNYENLLAMCSKSQRRFHKLTEWSESFITFARHLPYAQEFIFFDELDEN